MSAGGGEHVTERMVGQLAGQQAGTRLTDLAYNWYTRRMRRQLAGRRLPRHIGLIMDGNRRWARTSPAEATPRWRS
jgi:hypothetical protein